MYLVTQFLMAAIPGMEFPNHLALKANGAAFTCSTGGQQTAFPLVQEHPFVHSPHSHDYLPGLPVEEAGKYTHFQISPWKELNYIFSQLFHEGTVSEVSLHRCAD